MRVLISGAGPAGLTAALCLERVGIESLVVEKAPNLRRAGYAVGVRGEGNKVAARLGLLEQIGARALALGLAEYSDSAGRHLFSYDYAKLGHTVGGNQHAIMRDVLQTVLVDALGPKTEIRLGVSVIALEEQAKSISVGFSDRSSENFDIVIAADGYRSGVRKIWFGPDEDFLLPLSYRAAAWKIPSLQQLPASYVGYIDIDRQSGIYQVDTNDQAALFCWRDSDTSYVPRPQRTAILKSQFENWPATVSEAIADPIDWDAGYFDTIYQVVAKRWSLGRVVLLGDAAHCLTFLSGQGTSTAMIGAYVLAEELSRNDPEQAFGKYEQRMRPFVSKLQRRSRKIGGHYVPRSRLSMNLNRVIVPLVTSRPLSGILMKMFSSGKIIAD